MPKVYDCCIFFKELDMLDLRFHVLDPVVDYFIVCEAPETHSGNLKPMYFWEAFKDGRFVEFRNKIIYVNAGPLSDGRRDSWQRERYHRHQIREGLYGARMHDYVMVCDVDEIPHPDAIRAFLEQEIDGAMLPVRTFYYDLNHEVEYPWGMGIIRNGLESEPNKIRTGEGHNLPTIPIYGWHLSYFGGVPAVVEKLEAFMHHNDKYIAGVSERPDFIRQQIDAGGDLFGRTLVFHELTTDLFLPAYVAEHLDHYKELGWVK